MPADEKSPAWMIRLDLKVDQVIPNEFYTQFNVVMCCKELGSDQETPNPHIHAACVFSAPISKQTLRNRLRKLFPEHTGTKDLNIRLWKTYGNPDDDTFRYLCKGPLKSTKTLPEILYNGTLHNPLDLHEQFWVKNAQLKAETAKDDKKKPIYEIIIERMTKYDTYEEQWDEAVYRTLQFYKGKVNDHVAFPTIQAAVYHYYPDRTQYDFRARMLKKFSNY